LLAKTSTRRDDEPAPHRQKEKTDRDSGIFRLAARAIMRRAARVAVRLKTFGAAAKDTMRRAEKVAVYAEAEAESYAALDAANPFWDFSFDTGSGDGTTPTPDFSTLEL